MLDDFQASPAGVSAFICDKLADMIAKVTDMEKMMPYLKLMRDLKEIASEAGKMEGCGLTGKLAKRWGGYMMVIYGQLWLTDAEFMNPGAGEWWGYDAF
jgi:hypothetical protein